MNDTWGDIHRLLYLEELASRVRSPEERRQDWLREQERRAELTVPLVVTAPRQTLDDL